MRIDLAVNSIAVQVRQDVAFDKRTSGVFVFVCGRDQTRQPLGMCGHPPKFAGLERRIAFFRARIIDVMGVEGSRFPYRRRDLVHAHRATELLRQLSERLIAFLQAIVAPLFGGTLIDADAAPAHLEAHRQQVNFEPIGGARTFLIENWIEVFIQQQCADRILFGVASNETRR